MSDLIPQTAKDAYMSAMQDVADTFMTMPITINHRHTTLDEYGEHPVVQSTSYNIGALYQYTVGMGGRYHTIERTEMGQILHAGWKVTVKKSELDALGLVVDPEADSVTIEGKEYEIRFWSPIASLGNLGFIFYEFEVHFNTEGE